MRDFCSPNPETRRQEMKLASEHQSCLSMLTCAAQMIISSRMRVERLMETPSPMPGNTYAVRHTPGRKVRPSLSCTVSVLGRACVAQQLACDADARLAHQCMTQSCAKSQPRQQLDLIAPQVYYAWEAGTRSRPGIRLGAD